MSDQHSDFLKPPIMPTLDTRQLQRRRQSHLHLHGLLRDSLYDQKIAGRAVVYTKSLIYEYLLLLRTAPSVQKAPDTAKRRRTNHSTDQARGSWVLSAKITPASGATGPNLSVEGIVNMVDFQSQSAWSHLLMCGGDFKKTWSTSLQTAILWKGLDNAEQLAKWELALTDLHRHLSAGQGILPMHDLSKIVLLVHGKAVFRHKKGDAWLWSSYYLINHKWEEEGSEDTDAVNSIIYGWNIRAFHLCQLRYLEPLFEGRLWVGLVSDASFDGRRLGVVPDHSQQVLQSLVGTLIKDGKARATDKPRHLFSKHVAIPGPSPGGSDDGKTDKQAHKDFTSEKIRSRSTVDRVAKGDRYERGPADSDSGEASEVESEVDSKEGRWGESQDDGQDESEKQDQESEKTDQESQDDDAEDESSSDEGCTSSQDSRHTIGGPVGETRAVDREGKPESSSSDDESSSGDEEDSDDGL